MEPLGRLLGAISEEITEIRGGGASFALPHGELLKSLCGPLLERSWVLLVAVVVVVADGVVVLVVVVMLAQT